MASSQKERVEEFWNSQPCGTRFNPHPPESREFFQQLEEERNEREPFIARFARWPEWRGRRILEMGVGAGSDFVNFVRNGAIASGIDLTPNGVRLTRKRIQLEGLPAADVEVGDVERLAFPDNTFDFVYSWGVIHHTEDTAAAAREVVRVLRPGGQFAVMIYNRHSLVCLQAWLLYGLLRGRPSRSLDDIAANHLESFGTKVLSTKQARALFPGLPVKVTCVVTPYDLRVSRYRFLPSWVGRLVPASFGYFMVIEGTKPA